MDGPRWLVDDACFGLWQPLSSCSIVHYRGIWIRIEAIKNQLIHLMERDAARCGIVLNLDRNPSVRDDAKIRLNGELARVCQKYSGILFQVNPEWFRGGKAEPRINNESFYFYLIPFITDNRTVTSYYLCDYKRMREFVLDIEPSCKGRYSAQMRWRGTPEILDSTKSLGYLRWGGESREFSSPNRLIRLNNLDEYFSQDEDSFQEGIQNIPAESLKTQGPIVRPSTSVVKTGRYPRSAERSAAALLNARHLCEIDGSHETFISKKSGTQYVEAHHLIKMECQADFGYSLDVEENIVSLCPNCHKRLHHGKYPEIEAILRRLLTSREFGLKGRGILKPHDKLLEQYK